MISNFKISNFRFQISDFKFQILDFEGAKVVDFREMAKDL